MNQILVEVEEKIIHIVTVRANDAAEAREKALAFDCVEAESLAPKYRCISVRVLGDD